MDIQTTTTRVDSFHCLDSFSHVCTSSQLSDFLSLNLYLDEVIFEYVSLSRNAQQWRSPSLAPEVVWKELFSFRRRRKGISLSHFTGSLKLGQQQFETDRNWIWPLLRARLLCGLGKCGHGACTGGDEVGSGSETCSEVLTTIRHRVLLIELTKGPRAVRARPLRQLDEEHLPWTFSCV